jgi:gamma-glutamyltranspeptidase
MTSAPLAATGTRWAVATPHRFASQVAADAFAAGGNAVDAALQAAVTLAVVYPHMCGVGGDLFALVHRPDGAVVAIDSSGRAPAAIDVAALRAAHGTEMPGSGPASVTVPGAVAGWDALHRLGAALSWSSAFDAAIDAAARGFPISRDLAFSIARWAHDLRTDPGLAEVVYAPGVPAEDDLLVQPRLAETLTALATDGIGTLYGGDVGRRYADGLRRAGSPISIDDLQAHAADASAPLTHRYRDLEVLVSPPPSQGFVLLAALAAIERLGIDPDPGGPDAGTIANVLRAASAERDRSLADPAAMTIAVSTLLDDEHIDALLGATDVAVPVTREPRHEGDTIALATADADGWAVSLIESLYGGFGAGILEPSTGIVAHDRGGCFTLEPGHPNELAPGKRPAHTLMPVAVRRDGALVAVTGTRGGHGQPQIDLMSVVRAFDLGMDTGPALAAPRWLVGGMSPLVDDPWVVAEADVPATAVDDLTAKGYRVDRIGANDRALGHAQLIRIGSGTLSAGSDPRADGAALAT